MTIDSFSPVTTEEVVVLLKKSPGKTCALDLLPSRLIKQNTDTVASFITLLFNRSLMEGVFRDSFKRTINSVAEKGLT